MPLEIDLIYAIEGQEITRRSQVVKEDSTLAVTADVTSINAKVYDINGDIDTPIAEEVLVPEQVMSDTPQLEGWKRDKVGYNSKWTADRTYFPVGGHTYQVEVTYNLVSEGFVSLDAPAMDVFQVRTTGVRTR